MLKEKKTKNEFQREIEWNLRVYVVENVEESQRKFDGIVMEGAQVLKQGKKQNQKIDKMILFIILSNFIRWAM